jgi:hypothetical protein
MYNIISSYESKGKASPYIRADSSLDVHYDGVIEITKFSTGKQACQLDHHTNSFNNA